MVVVSQVRKGQEEQQAHKDLQELQELVLLL
jgi:hypothetical protein